MQDPNIPQDELEAAFLEQFDRDLDTVEQQAQQQIEPDRLNQSLIHTQQKTQTDFFSRANLDQHLDQRIASLKEEIQDLTWMRAHVVSHLPDRIPETAMKKLLMIFTR